MEETRTSSIWKIGWIAWGGVLLSSILFPLQFPRPGLFLLAWISLVTLNLALFGKTRGQAILLGVFFALASNLGKLYWIVATLREYGGINIVLGSFTLLLLCGYVAIFVVPYALFVSRVGDRWMYLAGVVAAAVWTLGEWAQTFFLTGFPWALLGYSQYRFLDFAQLARVTGVYGLSFVLVLCNFVIAAFIHQVWIQKNVGRTFFRHALAPGLMTFLVLGLTIAGRSSRSKLKADFENQPRVRVGLLQGNIDQDVKWNPGYIDRTLALYDSLSGEAVGQGAELLLLPETAMPMYFEHPRYQRYRERVLGWGPKHNADLILGSVAFSYSPDLEIYNSAYYVDRTGVQLQRYDKVHLVPFGEYLPLESVFSFLKFFTADIGNFSSTGRIVPLRSSRGEWSVGVLICYEIIFPQLAREFVARGANVLGTITNDAWFGTTSAPYQHFSMAALRAIESGVYVVRAANTGISGVIAPWGEVIQQSDIMVPAVVVEDIRPAPSQRVSFYVRYGDVFAWACLLVVVVWAVGSFFARRRILPS